MAGLPVPPGGGPPAEALLTLLEKVGRLPGPVKFAIKLAAGIGAAEASGGILTKHGTETLKFLKDVYTGDYAKRVEEVRAAFNPKDTAGTIEVSGQNVPLDRFTDQAIEKAIGKIAKHSNPDDKARTTLARLRAARDARAAFREIMGALTGVKQGVSGHVPMHRRDP